MCVPRNGPPPTGMTAIATTTRPPTMAVALHSASAVQDSLVQMTRRAHSFKRHCSNNNSSLNTQNASGHHHHENVIDFQQLNSPRSESPVSCDGSESFREAHASSVAQRVHWRSKIQYLSVYFEELGMELKGKKKLGQWMLLMFCGACLFMGVFKICVIGWFGYTVDRLSNNQDRVSHDYGYREGKAGLSIGSESLKFENAHFCFF